MKWLNLETNQRKNLALWMMFGGSLVFTLYAVAAFVVVRAELGFIFWLGLVAHIQIFSIMCGFIALLVKRRIYAGKQGIEIADQGTDEVVLKNTIEKTTTVTASPKEHVEEGA